MLCPFCGDGETRVYNSRSPIVGLVRRQRSCTSCGQRFSTTERIAAADMIVSKRDGGRERYSRAKLIRGLTKAAQIHNKTRPREKITSAEINAIAERVENQLQSYDPESPVPSIHIGHLVLQELHGSSEGLDIARIRYAIVFHGHQRHRGGFRGLSGLLEWLHDVYGPPVHERPPSTPWLVRKRDGRDEPFRLKALARSVGIAAKGHGTDEEVRSFADRIANEVTGILVGQAIVSSQQIAGEVLKLLIRERDTLAYLRYAAAVKPYSSVEDFWMDAYAIDREAVLRHMDEEL